MNLKTWDTAAHLKTPAEAAAYVDACIEESGGDPASIAKALAVITRAGFGLDDLSATAHLLSTPANAAHLARSIAQARSGQGQHHNLLEPGTETD